MFLIETFSTRDHPVVEAAVTRLVASDEQDRDPASVEGEENPDGVLAERGAEFLQVREP